MKPSPQVGHTHWLIAGFGLGLTQRPDSFSSEREMQQYDRQFFQARHSRTQHAAQTILDIVLQALPEVRSCVDVGCGVGTWLRTMIDRGIEDVLGAEGTWLDPSMLQIPRERFVFQDLREPITIDRRFDLAICLEVAEHVREPDGLRLIDALTRMADAVLFSAAIPGQGGEHHVNEQWQSYWAKHFADRGFDAFDLVRPAIWGNAEIDVWYRQNTILFVRSQAVAAQSLGRPAAPHSLSCVHPELYTRRMLRAESGLGGLKSAVRALVGGSERTRTLRRCDGSW